MVDCVVMLCSLVGGTKRFLKSSTLEVEAIYSSETSAAVYETTWRHISKEHDTQFHCDKNIIFHKFSFSSDEKYSYVNMLKNNNIFIYKSIICLKYVVTIRKFLFVCVSVLWV
jgi:hypothetical protein